LLIGKIQDMFRTFESSDFGNASQGPSVYDRLYSHKDKVPRSIAQEKHCKLEERDLTECTFTPTLLTKKPNKAGEKLPAESRDEESNKGGTIVVEGNPQPDPPPPPPPPKTAPPVPKGFSESISR
jgi:hypothetical protein